VSIGRREFLLGTPPVLASIGLSACGGNPTVDVRPRSRAPSRSASSVAYDAFACGAVPVAHVLELGGAQTDALRKALAAAGFDAKALPADVAPSNCMVSW
jgi:hypothetical protein